MKWASVLDLKSQAADKKIEKLKTDPTQSNILSVNYIGNTIGNASNTNSVGPKTRPNPWRGQNEFPIEQTHSSLTKEHMTVERLQINI